MKRFVSSVTLVIVLAGCAAPVASPSPSAMPTGADPTLPAPPTVEPSPSPSPPVATTSPSSPPSATPSPSTPPPSPTLEPASPTPVVGEPVAPSRIARFYDQIALGAEANGIAHVAAGTTNGIVHVTNATGAWERERITDAPDGGFDGDPSVAIDADGTVHVAFTRYATWFCFGIGCAPQDPQAIFVVTLGPGGWSSPVEVAGQRSMEPSLAVRGGTLHLAYERFDRSGTSRVVYAIGALGSLTTETVADDAYSPMLRVASDGTARVAFHDAATDELRYATAATAAGSFSIEPGPPGMSSIFDLDAADQPHFIGGAGYVTTDGSGWTSPQAVFPPGPDEDVQPGGIAVAADGSVQVISENVFSSGNGVWYGRLVGDSFETVQLYETDDFIEDGPPGSSAIALDASGHAHVAFTVLSEGDRGLWYTRDPGQ
jgi:hypothetical protein